MHLNRIYFYYFNNCSKKCLTLSSFVLFLNEKIYRLNQDIANISFSNFNYIIIAHDCKAVVTIFIPKQNFIRLIYIIFYHYWLLEARVTFAKNFGKVELSVKITNFVLWIQSLCR